MKGIFVANTLPYKLSQKRKNSTVFLCRVRFVLSLTVSTGRIVKNLNKTNPFHSPDIRPLVNCHKEYDTYIPYPFAEMSLYL